MFVGIILTSKETYAQCPPVLSNPISITVSATNELCLQGGSVSVASTNPAVNALVGDEVYDFQLIDANTNTVIQSWTSVSSFNNLSAGSYVVQARIRCAANATGVIASNAIQVQNGVVPLDFREITSSGLANCCNATITANVTGRGPLQYALVSDLTPAATLLTPLQSSPTFTGMCSGQTYYIRAYDACNFFVAKGITMAAQPAYTSTFSSFRITRYACDSFEYNINLNENFSRTQFPNYRVFLIKPNGLTDTIRDFPYYRGVFRYTDFSLTINPNKGFPGNVGNGPFTFTFGTINPCGVVNTQNFVYNPQPLEVAMGPERYPYGCDSVGVIFRLNNLQQFPSDMFMTLGEVRFTPNFNGYYTLGNSNVWKPLIDPNQPLNEVRTSVIILGRNVAHTITFAVCGDTVTQTFPAIPSMQSLAITPTIMGNYYISMCREGRISSTLREANIFGDSIQYEIIWNDAGYPTNDIRKVPNRFYSYLNSNSSQSVIVFDSLTPGNYTIKVTDYRAGVFGCPVYSGFAEIEVILRPIRFSLGEENHLSCLGNSAISFNSNNGAAMDYLHFEVLQQPNPTILPTTFRANVGVTNISSEINIMLRDLPVGKYKFSITDDHNLPSRCVRTTLDSIVITKPRKLDVDVEQSCRSNMLITANDTIIAFYAPGHNSLELEVYDELGARVSLPMTTLGGILGPASYQRIFNIPWSSLNNLVVGKSYRFRIFSNGDDYYNSINDSCVVSEFIWTKPNLSTDISGSILYDFCYDNTSVVYGNVVGGQAPYTWTLRESSINGPVVGTSSLLNPIFTGLNNANIYNLSVQSVCGDNHNVTLSTSPNIKLQAISNNAEPKVCVGDKLTLEAPYYPNVSYKWYKGTTYLSAVGDTSAYNLNVVSAADAGEYVAEMTFTSPTGVCLLKTDTFKFIFDINNCSPLPIKLADFNAYAVKNTAQLKWSTLTEIANKGFDIEHSVNGSTWNSIGFVNTLAEGGNSNAALNYQYTHLQPAAGVNYYRLKQVDFDGTSEYSKVRTVNIGSAKSSVVLYPNPANTEVTIQGLVGNETIVIFDVVGREMLRTQADQTAVTISLEKLVSGTYRVQVQGEYDVQSLPLIKNAND